MAVRFGVFVPQGWRMDLVEIEDPIEQYEAMTRAAQAADREEGWDSIWVFDHFHTVPTPEIETTFECWTITATLARDTRRVRVGQMVTCNGYRNPALLAKIASTVDVASHGRLYVGLGAGWYEHEWRAYGYGFPETRERIGMFREAVEIVHRMWTEKYPEFHGRYYTIDRPINEPKGVQIPHPPLWIGGGGERVTLRLVARWGDACNVGGDVETVRHKLDVLRRHCEEVGRDYGEIIKSTGLAVHLLESEADAERETARARGEQSLEEYRQNTIVGTPELVRDRLQPYVDIGIDYFIVTIPRNAYDQEMQTRFAREVVPLLA
ncbi:MAG: LLM class F420-dependent oxidoreductase [Chloroflexi bacterium]|nr:LLM class F420-dependent oxidoreductase [Chloroflexota bacterium]